MSRSHHFARRKESGKGIRRIPLNLTESIGNDVKWRKIHTQVDYVFALFDLVIVRTAIAGGAVYAVYRFLSLH